METLLLVCCGDVSISISMDGGGMYPDFWDTGDGEFLIGVVLVGSGIRSGDSFFGIFFSLISSLIEVAEDSRRRFCVAASEFLRDLLDSAVDSALDCALDETLEHSPSDLLELADR